MFILSTVPTFISPFGGNDNPHERLAEVRGKIIETEQRIRDLEALLTANILGTQTFVDTDPDTPGNQPPSGVDIDNANQIRDQLYKSRALQGELRSLESAWLAIGDENKKAEVETKDKIKKD